MKKKHRDITVEGVQYAWTVENYYRLKIWKDKKVIAEHRIAEHHDAVTPRLVAALITDPIDALKWINAQPCPFCGECVSQATPALSKNYFIILHTKDCYYYQMNEKFSMIPKDKIEIWDNREFYGHD